MPRTPLPIRFARRITIVAAVALLFATSAFLAHGFDKDRPHQGSKCELCLQFGGTAGTPAAATIVGKPLLVGCEPIWAPQPLRPFRRNVDSRLPRGPPSPDLI